MYNIIHQKKLRVDQYSAETSIADSSDDESGFKIPTKEAGGSILWRGFHVTPNTGLAALNLYLSKNETILPKEQEELVDIFQSSIVRKDGPKDVHPIITAAPDFHTIDKFGGSKTVEEFAKEYDPTGVFHTGYMQILDNKDKKEDDKSVEKMSKSKWYGTLVPIDGKCTTDYVSKLKVDNTQQVPRSFKNVIEFIKYCACLTVVDPMLGSEEEVSNYSPSTVTLFFNPERKGYIGITCMDDSELANKKGLFDGFYKKPNKLAGKLLSTKNSEVRTVGDVFVLSSNPPRLGKRRQQKKDKVEAAPSAAAASAEPVSETSTVEAPHISEEEVLAAIKAADEELSLEAPKRKRVTSVKAKKAPAAKKQKN